MYHKNCFASLDNKLKANLKRKDVDERNQWQIVRNIHLSVFQQFQPYLSDRIIQNREVVALSDIFSYYMRQFTEEISSSHAESMQSSFRQQHLLDKILKSRTDIAKIVYKKRTYLHTIDMDIQEVLSKGFEREDELTSKIKSVAMEIRKKINQMEIRKLPKQNIPLKSIIEGECNIPDELYLLIEGIVQGPSWPSKSETKRKLIKQNKISAICDTIIFNTSDGETKPSSCLSLALAIKSLTSSRRVLNILNRLGYCLSYTVTAAIETELAYFCSTEHTILPFELSPTTYTHCAFDNYDLYVETLTGESTLHDTVGIAYQNVNHPQQLSINGLQEGINDISLLNAPLQPPNDACPSNSRRRKYLSPFDNSLEPYTRRNEAIVLNGNKSTNLGAWDTAIDTNHLWMFNHALLKNDAKKWFAFHSERVIDSNPPQIIGYMPIINESPTKDAVVVKTLNMALKLADECHQDYISVTYDLAIAQKAYRILADTKSEFHKIFIMLGAFHTELAYFKVSVFLFIIFILL